MLPYVLLVSFLPNFKVDVDVILALVEQNFDLAVSLAHVHFRSQQHSWEKKESEGFFFLFF